MLGYVYFLNLRKILFCNIQHCIFQRRQCSKINKNALQVITCQCAAQLQTNNLCKSSTPWLKCTGSPSVLFT